MAQESERSATLSSLVAEEIRALMARRRMSGRQLAEKLGVSPSWVSYRLTGERPIDMNDLDLIALHLDVDVHKLLPPAHSASRVRSESGGKSGRVVPAARRPSPDRRITAPIGRPISTTTPPTRRDSARPVSTPPPTRR
jgi:transcriptional regulator with XRE-family HTH domain